MENKNILARVLGFALVFSYASICLAAESFVLKIEPKSLEIGMFFSGTMVNISGRILTNQEIVIEIIGPDEKSKFNMKAKVGPFWMNREKVELEHAPFLYKL